MYITLRTANTHKVETVYLPFATWADVQSLREYYVSRGLYIVEIKDGSVSL
jgi:hypothetical protein